MLGIPFMSKTKTSDPVKPLIVKYGQYWLAGEGGPQTTPIKAFNEDIIEVLLFFGATYLNASTLMESYPNDEEKFDRAAVGPILIELCLARCVDNAVNYVSEVLRLIYAVRPRGAPDR